MAYNDSNYYKPNGFGGFSFFPPIIKNLLIINGVVFLLQILSQSIQIKGVPLDTWLTVYFALMPLGDGFQIWQLITYQFMHGSFTHILFNMFALWMFGMEIENTWGSQKFLIFYLICGIGAGLLHIFITPLISGLSAPTIGASGAVYGVLIAFAMLFPNRYIFLYFFVPIKAKYLITFYIILEFLSVGSDSYVAHLAHLGGALFGFLYIIFDKNSKFSLTEFFGDLRKKNNTGNTFRRPSTFRNYSSSNTEEAEFYDINGVRKNKDDLTNITQEDIDRILDKISESGYQNLTEREKRILFEASKKN